MLNRTGLHQELITRGWETEVVVWLMRRSWRVVLCGEAQILLRFCHRGEEPLFGCLLPVTRRSKFF